MGGGVPAACIALAHCAGFHFFIAKQGIGQGGFARAGAPHQHNTLPRRQPRRQRTGTGGVFCIQRQHRHVQRAQRRQGCLHFGLGLVGFGQHDDRLHPAAAHQQQIAFDPARIEITIQTAHHKHGIDIRRDHLLAVMLAGGAALDRRKPWQQSHDAQ